MSMQSLRKMRDLLHRAVLTVVIPALIPLSIVFLITAAGVLLFSLARDGPTTVGEQYSVFRDTLTIVLSAAALAVVVLGTGAFLILRDQLKREIAGTVGARSRGAIATALSTVGRRFYNQYEHTKDPFYLDEAISITSIAFNFYAYDLNDKEKDFERVICDIRNNWGYYLAEKSKTATVRETERTRAREFASYLEARLLKFPDEDTRDWRETISFIRERFPG